MPIQRAQPDEPPAHPPTAAVLRQSQRVLHLYTEAFGGRSFELRSTDELPATERGRDRRLPSSSVHCVFLPEAIDDYPTTAENFAVFKVDILHQLGHWECGTFGFSLARWQGRQAATHTAGSEVGLAGFFERFSRPELARRLFVTFESGRIDAHLARRYRGLAPDLRRVMASALADRPRVSGLPQRAALLEALVQLSLGTDLAQDSPPPIAARIEQLAQWCSQLASLEATVYTTADAVEACMALFDDLPSRTAGRTGAGASSADESEEAFLAEGPPGDRTADDNAIESVAPVEFRGEFKPDLVQKELELANLIVS
ncbi:MAG: hypothetical protein VYE73_10475, partial [Acidobacteriota bacterium]|nr:hypothetical protein [Acidobacteriota bacterium]